MRLKLPHRSCVSHALALIAGLLLGWGALPVWRSILMAYNQEDYGRLVEQCDSAMRDHFQAKRAIELTPSVNEADNLAASEIGLIVCQDYDLYQKRLLQWGLRESELAQMRLKAIEARASDLREVVEIHEIRF